MTATVGRCPRSGSIARNDAPGPRVLVVDVWTVSVLRERSTRTARLQPPSWRIDRAQLWIPERCAARHPGWYSPEPAARVAAGSLGDGHQRGTRRSALQRFH